jgi:hypothetical protein
MLALALAAGAVALLPPVLYAQPKAETMKIRITIDGKAVEGTLLDNATARDLVSLLPLEVQLKDHAATEKIAYLPRKLSTAGAPEGSTPSAGDIAYYAPWGNLALFHKGFEYSPGLVLLGRIDTGLEALRSAGAAKATIERVTQ